VIIHELAAGHLKTAWILDADDPPATSSSTEGVMWRPGETFVDPAGIEVEVKERSADGFRLQLTTAQAGPLYVNDFESGPRGFFLSNLWHITSACEAVRSGHSPIRALFFGLDGQCDYETGDAVSGAAYLTGLDLSGLSPPYTLSFNYSLTTSGDSARVLYFDGGTRAWEVLASNQAALHPLPETGGPWGRFEAILPLSPSATETGIYFSFSADSLGNDLPGFWIDDIEIDGCFAAGVLHLTSTTVTSVQLHEACETIEAGNGYEIAGSGDVTLRAGSRIELGDGFVVRSGGRLQAVIGPPVAD
jgi:hypothetical protein